MCFHESRALASIKPTKADIEASITMGSKKDAELDALDAGLEADILTLIPERSSGVCDVYIS